MGWFPERMIVSSIQCSIVVYPLIWVLPLAGLDEEYKYWSYVEMHPAFTILSRKSVQEAVDTLHWSSTDRLFALPHTNQPPFGQEECEELLKLLNDSNRQRDPSYTRIIARIHLRLGELMFILRLAGCSYGCGLSPLSAHWHQAHFRSHKLLPCGAIITHQSKQTWFLLGMMVELFGMLSVDIQSYVDKTRCSGRYDGKGSARTCSEMSFVMVVMFSIILGGFVMLLSFLVSGTMHLFAGLFSVLCIATSVLLFLRHFSNMH
ncbi:hypothetical protein M404DRAFT_442514 [Pisolithus tinctorius Marx 270]|uniref:Uncharacterized protein n=1 Tax=Pisolithus tinctorius Marx 270 TaxID=870435 RepID=A0A0C3JCS8_PISTI|nr:hypothetical protein M404DRAFT_442514 [Pisolithus tinctorius Marx 270]